MLHIYPNNPFAAGGSTQYTWFYDLVTNATTGGGGTHNPGAGPLNSASSLI